jgi:hypothetical protein
MVWFGATLTRLLARVTALMTVTVGVPRCECICPDGTVKLFCSGRSDAGCCASTCDNPVVVEGPDQVSEKPCPCCSHARAESDRQVARSTDLVIRACGCQRAIVMDSLPTALNDVVDVGEAGVVEVAAWALIPSSTAWPGRSSLVGRQSPLPSPSLVVLFCHFTC